MYGYPNQKILTPWSHRWPSAGFTKAVTSRFARLRVQLQDWRDRTDARRAFRCLNDQMLRDIGLTRPKVPAIVYLWQAGRPDLLTGHAQTRHRF
jgi:uncharacterized protein YjiS (DUF1127 family)